MMTARGLYIHIPFCLRKCNYCDFCSEVGCDSQTVERYIDRLLAEAESYHRDRRIRIDTLYIGGGTPSLLSTQQLSRLLRGLAGSFDFCSGMELTLEANPGTLTTEKVCGYKELGINRISVGLQSIHDNELKILGRIHTYENFLSSYKLLRDTGFDNINVDLMYGIPEQTVQSFEKTLRAVTELSPEHISAYGLIVEEGTPFYERRDELRFPDEDDECEMYYMADRILSSAGYGHYEISNYTRPNFESRHNLKYWRDEEYIGLGAAAYSYFEGVRFGNDRRIDGYCRLEREIIDKKEEMYEYAMMHLRLASGFALSDYERRFGCSFLDGRSSEVGEYVDRGLMDIRDGRIFFTPRGWYISNGILANIL